MLLLLLFLFLLLLLVCYFGILFFLHLNAIRCILRHLFDRKLFLLLFKTNRFCDGNIISQNAMQIQYKIRYNQMHSLTQANNIGNRVIFYFFRWLKSTQFFTLTIVAATKKLLRKFQWILSCIYILRLKQFVCVSRASLLISFYFFFGHNFIMNSIQ